ncbi:hypothetical protein [Streptomyces brasiliscabiei]|uniref:hypothetical protein n=1 Tax=Streptomyces brasiliscabiei TaxID=2736302 RepID=UPI0038F6D999
MSHHIARMAGRGLVVREECTEDGRGAYVVITDAGRSAIEAARPAPRRGAGLTQGRTGPPSSGVRPTAKGLPVTLARGHPN